MFRTAKGTELPIMNLKGKDYLEVKWRLVWFREEHPDWSISTTLVTTDAKHTITRAEVKDATGRVIATGHKREDETHFVDHIEKSETGAIGRALSLCGYGTQFTDELEEGARIVDAPVDRKPPATKASALNTKVAAMKPKPSGLDRKALNEEILALHSAFVEFFGADFLSKYMTDSFGTAEPSKLTDEQLKQLCDWMKNNPKSDGQVPTDLGSTVIDVKVFHNKKPLQGRTFGEVGKGVLADAAKSTHEWFLKEKRPINAAWQSFFSKAEEYCFAPDPASVGDEII